MSTVIATTIYVMFAIAYISMLALTERSAAHYVRDTSKAHTPRVSLVLVRSSSQPAADNADGPATAA